MWRSLKRLFHQATIGDQDYRFLFRPGPADEVVVIDTETTGLDPRTDDVVSIAAIRVKGNRILTSERFEAVAKPDAAMAPAAIKVHRIRASDAAEGELIYRVLPDFLHFVGGRPLVGYFIEFDVAMLDKYVLGFIGTELPNPLVEVSRLYHERKYGDAPPGTVIDLTFAAMMRDLDIPDLGQHDAFNDALMTAMMYLRLKDLKERGIRIPRARGGPRPTMPTG